jgi:hypothetical protein
MFTPTSLVKAYSLAHI